MQIVYHGLSGFRINPFISFRGRRQSRFRDFIRGIGSNIFVSTDTNSDITNPPAYPPIAFYEVILYC